MYYRPASNPRVRRVTQYFLHYFLTLEAKLLVVATHFVYHTEAFLAGNHGSCRSLQMARSAVVITIKLTEVARVFAAVVHQHEPRWRACGLPDHPLKYG